MSMVCDISDGSWLSFCADRVKSQAEQPYPSGIPPIQALARLALRGRRYTNRKPLDSFPDLATVIQQVYPGFLETLGSSNNTDYPGHLKGTLEKLGVSTHEGLLEKLVGKPFKDIAAGALDFMPTLLHMAKNLQFPISADDPWPSLVPDVVNFFKDLTGMRQHTAFVTSKGYIGWGRKGLRSGDRVCVLPGCLMPVLPRKLDSHFIHLGVCYVEGLMNGEVMSHVRDGTEQVETFDIV